MSRYSLQSALLPQGWSRDVAVTVSDEGFITAIDTASATGRSATAQDGSAGAAAAADTVERIDGIVVPGMPNAHSHAFQRAMAGNTEYRLSARDSFWTWRQAMYALANRIEPEDLRILAAQLFIEMLKSGYTSVAEFHYLHRQRNGLPYDDENALWAAIDNAASVAGIGLTFLPTLYQTSDFGGRPLKAEQARFESDTDYFMRAVEHRIAAERLSDGRVHGQGQRSDHGDSHHSYHGARLRRTGVAFHSLRAVSLNTLREVTSRLREIDPDIPLHIHVAEQLLEVQACVRETGRRPIELLLETGLITNQWCLVHATHATAAELKGVADSGAAICVSISTEANLGDGFFDTARYLKAGGRLCVGSDSQASVNPAEELRWLEYQQRLRKKRRGVLATKADPHVGTRLWRDAAQHGAQAIGQSTGSIEIGRRADWLVLDAAHSSMVGAAPDTALDHLLFAGGDAAIRHVMVAGRWVIKDRRHAAENEIGPRFGLLMRRLTNDHHP
jgi:formimidoylglutamate deiminase